ncbi:Cro/CI family transcriptional regulator [Morganella morganii]|uniref:Cell division protein n=1 Tax=Morganella morganii TaxID=582 RepID=A0AAN5MDW7_MORMO|nr:Cro/CI family transcriptional regulator [Morganella morganii]EKK5571200.1 cell division protein [Morganella morganii]MBA5820742.1 cell division protein [Morganella morganii]MBT0316506.1 cell division protein [Morganella morganii subsp. morganii]MBT0338302.1 cell division protein [Morganella morganii subsp. morganii]MBT0357985.1 cell division protein [Morganella morganii subsp. morganii]
MTTSEVESYFGDANKVADFFGITPEAFYQWKKRPGGLIPKSRAFEAACRTDGKLKFDPILYKQGTKTL